MLGLDRPGWGQTELGRVVPARAWRHILCAARKHLMRQAINVNCLNVLKLEHGAYVARTLTRGSAGPDVAWSRAIEVRERRSVPRK